MRMFLYVSMFLLKLYLCMQSILNEKTSPDCVGADSVGQLMLQFFAFYGITNIYIGIGGSFCLFIYIALSVACCAFNFVFPCSGGVLLQIETISCADVASVACFNYDRDAVSITAATPYPAKTAMHLRSNAHVMAIQV